MNGRVDFFLQEPCAVMPEHETNDSHRHDDAVNVVRSHIMLVCLFSISPLAVILMPIRVPQREHQVGELAPLELGDKLLVHVMAKLARVVFEDGLCRFARRGVEQNDRSDIVAVRLGNTCDLLGQDPHAYPVVPRGEAKIDQLARAPLHVFRGGEVVQHEQGVGPREEVAGHPQLDLDLVL